MAHQTLTMQASIHSSEILILDFTFFVLRAQTYTITPTPSAHGHFHPSRLARSPPSHRHSVRDSPSLPGHLYTGLLPHYIHTFLSAPAPPPSLNAAVGTHSTHMDSHFHCARMVSQTRLERDYPLRWLCDAARKGIPRFLSMPGRLRHRLLCRRLCHQICPSRCLVRRPKVGL